MRVCVCVGGGGGVLTTFVLVINVFQRVPYGRPSRSNCTRWVSKETYL